MKIFIFIIKNQIYNLYEIFNRSCDMLIFVDNYKLNLEIMF